MAVLKDFKCRKCGVFEELVTSDAQVTACKTCGISSKRIFLQSAAITGEVRNHWNPHYDLQLGQYFNSRKEKQEFLNKTGRIQYSGQMDPRKDSKTMFRCTKSQAKKEFGIAAPKALPRCTNDELK